MADTPTAPAAPAAPAAAPAAPTATPATPPAAAAPASTATDKFSDLDARAAAKRQKPAAETPAAPGTTDKKTETPAAAAPAAAAKPGDALPAGTPKQLREQLTKVERERDDNASEVGRLRAKISDYEKKGLDTTALSERLTTAENENRTLQAQIRALKREASPEFKEKYEKPFHQQAEFAKRIIEQLEVTEGEGQQPRRATWNDFVSLYNMPYNKAVTLAKQLFGDASAVVVQHLTNLQQLDFTRSQALKEEQERWQQSEHEEVARAAREKEFVQSTYTSVNKDIAERHPDWYLEDPKDPEGNALLKEGYALVDSQPSTVQEKIVRDAHIRLKAAAFPRLVHRLSRLQEQLEDANAKIAELQGSAPGAGQRRAGSGDAPQSGARKDWKTDLKETMG